MKNRNGFENIVKEKLEQQHYDYDPSQWNAIEKRLPSPKKVLPWKGIAAASTLLVVSLLIWQLMEKENSSIVENEQQVISNKDGVPVPEKTAISSTENQALQDFDAEQTIIVHDRVYDHAANNEDEEKTTSDKYRKVPEHEFVPDEESNTTVDDKTTKSSQLNQHGLSNASTGKISRPSAQFSLNKTSICTGEVIDFQLLSQSKQAQYFWDFGNGVNSTDNNPVYQYPISGTYYVQLKATSTLDASVMNISDKIAIHVLPAPKAEFRWSENSMNAIPSIQFQSNSATAVYWEWDFDNGIKSTEKEPFVTFNKKGFYTISHTVTNVEGCSKSSSQQLEITTDYNLLAPNSFTPNADGINDNFIPKALEILNVNFEMSIFDKRGLVYSTTSVSFPWNGSNQRDGGMCPQGAYVWVVKYIDHEGKDQIFKGTINLLK